MLLRGAAYTPLDGAPPADPLHHGVGMPYAHVTAPIRRLVDRFGSEVCVALAAGAPVPDWARSALPRAARADGRGRPLAGALDRAVVDATEAWLLTGQEGRDFPAVVLDAGTGQGHDRARRAGGAGAPAPVPTCRWGSGSRPGSRSRTWTSGWSASPGRRSGSRQRAPPPVA